MSYIEDNDVDVLASENLKSHINVSCILAEHEFSGIIKEADDRGVLVRDNYTLIKEKV